MESSWLPLNTDCKQAQDQDGPPLESPTSTLHRELYDEEDEPVRLPPFCMSQLTIGD
jgi:hypothetical protein